MEISEDIFELNFKDGMIRVQRHLVSNQIIYMVVFSDKRNPLVITRALKPQKQLHQTSPICEWALPL